MSLGAGVAAGASLVHQHQEWWAALAAMLDAWERGERMQIEAYAGHVPVGAHEEQPIWLYRP
jgi:hypothetical protein